ncbi:MAG TPA: hypothetical protein VG323_15305 [Thermoanaerobaculia bacterium]|nr:hypothetical protein [Thermoanaerobaculia bacterium]
MTSELDAIAAADEEARSRVSLAVAARERDVGSARTARDAAIEARADAEQQALDRELRAIADDGEQRLAAMKAQQTTFLAALAAAGEAKLDQAVAAYARIVGGVT